MCIFPLALCTWTHGEAEEDAVAADGALVAFPWHSQRASAEIVGLLMNFFALGDIPVHWDY